MKIVIVGAGVVGTSLAEQLSQEGHSVAVIDESRERIRQLKDKLDVLALHGDGASQRMLKKASVQEAGLAIAVTQVDEVNLAVGMLARKLGAKRTIVRIRKPEYNQAGSVLSLSDLGIDQCINPEPTIVDTLLRMIEIPGCNDLATLAGGQLLKVGFKIDIDSPIVGQTLATLREVGDLNAFLVLYIVRGETVIVPRGDDAIEPHDYVHLLVSAETIPFVLPMIHRQPPRVRQVIVVGASRMSVQLARQLEERIDQVFLIENDMQRAEEVAAELPKTTVLAGDPTSLDVLEEASITRCDLFCALSDDDHTNMLASLLAQKHGAKKGAVLVHQPEYVPVLESLGVEIVLNPRFITVGEILTHIRKGQVHSVTRLAENQAEILEFEVPSDCRATRSPIKELKFPQNALVGALIQLDGTILIPSGDTRIQPGERAIVYALPEAIQRIERLFIPER